MELLEYVHKKNKQILLSTRLEMSLLFVELFLV